MSKPAPLRIDRILPRANAKDPKTSSVLTAREVQTILRIAYLAGEADGRIADEEQDTFRELAGGLKKLAPKSDELSDAALDTILDALADELENRGLEACLKDVARTLERPIAKDLAYKVVVAMSLADLERGDDETDFDDEVVAALGLSEEQADTLADDVYAALEDEE